MSPPRQPPPWPLFVILGISLAVGLGIQRQPGWESRILQILASGAVAGLVALVLVLLLRRWQRK